MLDGESSDYADDLATAIGGAGGQTLRVKNRLTQKTGLLLGTNLSSEQRDYAQTVRQSADTLLTIVSEILDFSKIESGKLAHGKANAPERAGRDKSVGCD